jgi:hypothetical protein
MRLIEASIHYMTGRKAHLSREQISKVEKNNLLLFPTSPIQDDAIECIADRWIGSFGTHPFVVGDDEIKHTIIQHQFYSKSTNWRIAANHERFVRFHLPRILFCEALHRVLSEGPLSGRLHSLQGDMLHDAKAN